jgi:hydroxyethylthiazole kinase-like uncharacterized protein yjeF
MKVVDSRRMGAIDRAAQERFAVPEIVLMEDAGRGMFTAILEMIWRDRPPDGAVVFLAGKGNNGGDALVIARHCRLAGMKNLAVILGSGEPAAESLAGVHLKTCRALGIETVDHGGGAGQVRRAARLLAEARWLVDGLLGTGLSGEVRPPLQELIRRCNQTAAARIAVDVPSGIGDAYRKGYTAFRADFTLTVELPKLCLYLPHARGFCGEIHTVRGVFPPELAEQEDIPGYLIDREVGQRLLRPLSPGVHKGSRGHLGVFAGSTGTTGAAWLCSNAAARSRAGLVTLFVDRELYGPSISKYSSVMLRPWDGDPPELGRIDTLLVGPGWGLTTRREQVLAGLLDTRMAGVLDADGVSLLARMRRAGALKLGGRWVLTPHPGEFSRLLDMDLGELLDDPLPHAVRAAAELEAVIVLKGHCSLVVSPEGRYGVLAGICAGLLTSGCSPEDAAVLGVLLHSEIGRRLYEERGYFLAEDMLEAVSLVCRG